MYPLDLIINNINVTFSMLLPSMKCRQKGRQKGMVVILCVCVSVCLQHFGKTTNIGGSIELLTDFKLYKDQK